MPPDPCPMTLSVSIPYSAIDLKRLRLCFAVDRSDMVPAQLVFRYAELLPDQGLHLFDQGKGVHPVFLQEVLLARPVGKSVPESDSYKPLRDAGFRHLLGDDRPQAADDGVVFHGDNTIPGFHNRLKHGLVVKRFKRRDMHMPNPQPPLPEHLRPAHPLFSHYSAGQQRDVVPFGEHPRRAKLHRERAIEETWGLAPEHPNIDRSVDLLDDVEDGLHLDVIEKI